VTLYVFIRVRSPVEAKTCQEIDFATGYRVPVPQSVHFFVMVDPVKLVTDVKAPLTPRRSTTVSSKGKSTSNQADRLRIQSLAVPSRY
jgi:hypothetical protein